MQSDLDWRIQKHSGVIFNSGFNFFAQLQSNVKYKC